MAQGFAGGQTRAKVGRRSWAVIKGTQSIKLGRRLGNLLVFGRPENDLREHLDLPNPWPIETARRARLGSARVPVCRQIDSGQVIKEARRLDEPISPVCTAVQRGPHPAARGTPLEDVEGYRVLRGLLAQPSGDCAGSRS